MIATGFLTGAGEMARVDEAKMLGVAAMASSGAGGPGPNSGVAALPFRPCPKCGQASLVYEEGCDNCRSCGYSKCS